MAEAGGRAQINLHRGSWPEGAEHRVHVYSAVRQSCHMQVSSGCNHPPYPLSGLHCYHTDVWYPAFLLTAQHVKLYLTPFALPAGQKTAQHVELCVILFAWISLMVPLFLQRSRKRDVLYRALFYGCALLLFRVISQPSTFHTRGFYTRMRIVKDVRCTIHIDNAADLALGGACSGSPPMK